MTKKKAEEVEAPMAETVEETIVQNGDNITVHADRQDSGTNYLSSDQLPSLNDKSQK